MKLGRHYFFSYDDSGGVEPILNKSGEFYPGIHPYTIIASVGINADLRDEFNGKWQDLRQDIAHNIGSTALPPIHARLMLGTGRPNTYRGAPNPYLNTAHEQGLAWIMEGFRILRWASTKKGGCGVIYTNSDRAAEGERFIKALAQPIALAEIDFIKRASGLKRNKFFASYLSRFSAALINPLFRTLLATQETLRQINGTGHLLLDPFAESSGMDDAVVSNFVQQSLGLERIVKIERVSDTDEEPACQAADILAYGYHRQALMHHRKQKGELTIPDLYISEALSLFNPRPLCSKDMGVWLQRQYAIPQIRHVVVAAQYALAHHGLHAKNPDFVSEYFLTPEEFLARVADTPPDSLYVPILKDGVLKAWEARKGEDRA
jgi:hypothetical protein